MYSSVFSMMYFLNFLAEMCRKEGIDLRYVHLDLTTARPCFRALNDLVIGIVMVWTKRVAILWRFGLLVREP